MTQQTIQKHISALALPTLWVEDVLPAYNLSRMFQIRSFKETTDLSTDGDHYIFAQKDTPEAHVKAIAYKIRASGAHCLIYGAYQPLEHLLKDDVVTAKELTLQIFEYAQSLDDWAVWKETQKLSPREAADIAKVAIALLNESQKLVELAQLRQRSDQSSWDWGNVVKSLEKEFAEELQRRQVKSASSDPDERLRLELLTLSKETDPVKRLRKRSEICSHYRIKSADVEHLCRYLERGNNQSETKVYSLDNLLSMESQGLQWLIPELLPKGETIILAGSPKAGKSLLAVDAAFAIATGESSFLGESVIPGKVLLISVDESLMSTRNKLLKRGFRHRDSPNVRVLPSWTIDQMNVLEAQLEDFRPDVVIVDSLRRINHGSAISENSAEFADNIYTLKETIARYGASGILIHHSNKNSEAMGIDKLRGSSAIAGAVWGTWQLEHIPKPDPKNRKKLMIDPEDPTRSLTVFVRDTKGQTLKIEFDPENNSWGRLDEEVFVEQQTMRQRILNILQLNGGSLGGKEMIELLAADKGIYTELNRMVNKKLITSKPAPGNNRYTIYSLPTTELSVLPPTKCEPIVISEAENLSQQDIQTSNSVGNNVQLIDDKLDVLTLELDVESIDDVNVSGVDNKCSLKGGEWISTISSTESDSQPSESVQELNRVQPELPPVGSWVRVDGKVAQVIKHYPDVTDRVILDGQPAGTLVYGVYRASECIMLTKIEILQLGLTSK